MPLSHDEVVHGKSSLLGKMPGDPWQKFANLRLLLGYMYGQSGKKLLFMGAELGQWGEWNHESSLDWHLLELLRMLVCNAGWRISTVYTGVCRPCMKAIVSHQVLPGSTVTMPKIACSVSCARVKRPHQAVVLVVCNFTPVPRLHYRLGVSGAGVWREVLNSDAQEYGGSGLGNLGRVEAEAVPYHGRPYSLDVCLPPLAVTFFLHEGEQPWNWLTPSG